MPIYEYQCQSCQHQLEVLQKVSDEALKECPVCHKETLSKLISATSFQLKGTGWYETDFKTKNQPEKSTSSSSSIKKDTTTDTSATSPKKDDPSSSGTAAA